MVSVDVVVVFLLFFFFSKLTITVYAHIMHYKHTSIGRKHTYISILEWVKVFHAKGCIIFELLGSF